MYVDNVEIAEVHKTWDAHLFPVCTPGKLDNFNVLGENRLDMGILISFDRLYVRMLLFRDWTTFLFDCLICPHLWPYWRIGRRKTSNRYSSSPWKWIRWRRKGKLNSQSFGMIYMKLSMNEPEKLEFVFFQLLCAHARVLSVVSWGISQKQSVGKRSGIPVLYLFDNKSISVPLLADTIYSDNI